MNKATVQQLVDQINNHNYHYYVLDKPIISDSEYDKLYAQLVQIESDTGIILFDSPTQRVGSVLSSKFASHRHIKRLYSLDKVNSTQELLEWANKIEKRYRPKYSLEYKIDGITIVLTYRDGLLCNAATRGNGVDGENITGQVKACKSVPLKISYTGLVEVQGEGFMRLSDLERYNSTASEPIKNARNGVAGAFRNLDPQVVSDRYADIFFYNINHIDDSITTQSQAIQWLRDNRFRTLDSAVYDDIDDLIVAINDVQRSSLDFLIDGMVVKVEDFEIRQKLGATDKFPRWAVAFKFEAQEVSTVVTNIVWQVGRTGKLTPLAILDPVDIGGVTVSRATLNNMDDIVRKGVGVGSTVFVRRSNDVIPEILYSVDGTGRQVDIPELCPECRHKVVQDGVHIFCRNNNCKSIACGKLEHFVSRECMDIESISRKTIDLLYDKEVVRQPSQLYGLDREYLQSLQLEGFGDKKIDNLLAGVAKSKARPLSNYINALCIPNVGKKTAHDLAKVFGSIDMLAKADTKDLIAIDEIGGIVAQSIVDYFEDWDNCDQIRALKQYGIDPRVEAELVGVLNKMVFVITGTLSHPRSYFDDLIKEHGGTVADSVTKNTTHLLAGANAGSKLVKATKLGLSILTEDDLAHMIGL